MNTDVELGTRWAAIRRITGLSREKFAQRAEITPSAVWRIEAKGSFKPGELEKLEAAFPGTPSEAAQTPPAAPLPVPVSVQPTVVITPSTEVLAVPRLEPQVADMPELSPYQRWALDGIYRVSNSEIQAFKQCRRRWLLGYYRKLQPKQESPNGVRQIGNRLHRALRWHYHPDTALRTDVQDALERIIAFDRSLINQDYEHDVTLTELLNRFERESDLERIIVEGYIQWLGETGVDSDLKFVDTERYLEASLPGFNDEVRLVAKIDARVRRVSDDLRLFIDHKSLGDFTRSVRILPLDEQMLFYQLVESLQTSETARCVGAIYNMMRRVKRTATAKPPFYMRVEVHHNAYELANFLTRTQGVVRDMIEIRRRLDDGESHRLAAYPTPGPDCTWKCSYFEIDPMMDDNSRVEDALAAYFTVGDPSGYYVRDEVMLS